MFSSAWPLQIEARNNHITGPILIVRAFDCRTHVCTEYILFASTKNVIVGAARPQTR